MLPKRPSPVEELKEILTGTNLRLTFDRFRDITQGCGTHCYAWERGTPSGWCQNHSTAIAAGEYDPLPREKELHVKK